MRKRIAFSIAVALLSAQASAVTLSCETEGGGPTKEYSVIPEVTQGVLYSIHVGYQLPFKLLSPGGGSVSTTRWSIVGDAHIVTRDNGGIYRNHVARGTAVTGDSYIKTVVEQSLDTSMAGVTVSMDQSLPSGQYTVHIGLDLGREMQGRFMHNSTQAAPNGRWELPDFFEIPDAARGEVHTITFPGTTGGTWGRLDTFDGSNDLFYLTDRNGTPFTTMLMTVGLESYDLLVNVRPDAEPGTRTSTIRATLTCN